MIWKRITSFWFISSLWDQTLNTSFLPLLTLAGFSLKIYSFDLSGKHLCFCVGLCCVSSHPLKELASNIWGVISTLRSQHLFVETLGYPRKVDCHWNGNPTPTGWGWINPGWAFNPARSGLIFGKRSCESDTAELFYSVHRMFSCSDSMRHVLWLVNLSSNVPSPPQKWGLIKGLWVMNHWFPLARPYLTLISAGGHGTVAPSLQETSALASLEDVKSSRGIRGELLFEVCSKQLYFAPPKFNRSPLEKWWFEDEFSFWDGLFSGAMSNFQGVDDWYRIALIAKQQSFPNPYVSCFWPFLGMCPLCFFFFRKPWGKFPGLCRWMTLQCSVVSGMTRDDILITKDRPISWKITNIAFMKWRKLTNWYCFCMFLLHYQPGCHDWGVWDDVVFDVFRKISLERELMRLRKGALNAYGSLDGPMLHDDVELEVGKKLQMLLMLIKFIKGCHFNPFHNIYIYRYDIIWYPYSKMDDFWMIVEYYDCMMFLQIVFSLKDLLEWLLPHHGCHVFVGVSRLADVHVHPNLVVRPGWSILSLSMSPPPKGQFSRNVWVSRQGM